MCDNMAIYIYDLAVHLKHAAPIKYVCLLEGRKPSSHPTTFRIRSPRGSLCESIVHSRYIGSKRSDGSEVTVAHWRLDGARSGTSGHAAKVPTLRPERAALALWATPGG